ncbi:hypothetical protein COW53_07700 [bacterium CG17_big_fil_post_rev_8_21_14_2_50_64_8]|nr:MAG: hypothetical protein COW53_07700 [bacterium CG17_big_fil_post_rev_8_21_14_2_50_64_8]PJA74312.1 MAG: hypothetical protein CO151_10085 [bacterium CG_4_9_14_3_um_filter_65_15]
MAAAIKQEFGSDPEMIPSSGGVFEVSLDGELIFSKKALERFPEDGEIQELIRSRSG